MQSFSGKQVIYLLIFSNLLWQEENHKRRMEEKSTREREKEKKAKVSERDQKERKKERDAIRG